MARDLDRALALLGPLEARIMRTVWSGAVPGDFVVRDVTVHLPDLAYTTVMTTVNRLADKGLLDLVPRRAPQRAHHYVGAESPREFLARTGQAEADALVDRLGDVALAAFTAHVDRLSVAQRERLRRLASR